MKKKDVQSMVRLMLTPVLMVILGIVLVVRPDSASALVGKILGWVLLLIGIGLLIESIAVKELTTSRILFVVVAAALGLWLVRNPLRLAAALGRVAGLLILVRAVQDIINAARWKCGMKYALLSAIIGGLLILSGMVMAAIQLFGSGGVPFHKDKHCYLVFEELYFDRGVRADVVQSVEDGAVDRLLGLARANVPALTVALYRTPDNSFAAMQAFEYADLEYKPLTRLNIVDKA